MTARTFVGLVGSALLVPSMALGASAATADVATSKAAGSGVQGDVTFDCLLEPFKSAFRLQGDVVLSAPQNAGEDGTIALVGSLPELPGIAPVAIENGTMRVALEGRMGKEPFTLEGSRTVNAGASESVAIPEVSGDVVTDGAGEVTVSKFSFEFDEMMGLVITAECDPSRGASMGTMERGSAKAAAPVADMEAAAAPDEAEPESGLPMAALVGVPVALVLLGAVFFVLRGRAQRS